MQIDRNALVTGPVAASAMFKKSYLGCRDCSGLCWHYHQLRSLPETVLKSNGEDP